MKRYLTSSVTREAWEMQIKTSTDIAKTKKKSIIEHYQEYGATELFHDYANFRGITTLGVKKRNCQYLLNKDLCLRHTHV